MKDIKNLETDLEVLKVLLENDYIELEKNPGWSPQIKDMVNMCYYDQIDADGYHESSMRGYDSGYNSWSRKQLRLLQQHGYLDSELRSSEEV